MDEKNQTDFNSTPDKELIRQTLDGDKAAFGQLYDRYARLVRIICFDAVRKSCEVDDLSQDVFTEAYVKLGKLKKHDQFACWLTGIARNKCRNWLKKSRLRDNKTSNILPPDAAAPDGNENTDDLLQLHAYVLELPQKERLAIQLHYLYEKSTEISQKVLNLSQSGLYEVLKRARTKLYKALQTHRKEARNE